MDFNDLTNRVERLYASIDDLQDFDLKNKIVVEQIPVSNGTMLKTYFGAKDNLSELNSLVLVIHNIANLKDHLKKKLAKDIVENHIDASNALKIIIDLSNAEKHSYPTTSNRSGLNPKIKNIQSGLKLGAQSTIEMNALTGDVMNLEGTAFIEAIATIVDENDNVLMNSDQLFIEAIDSWEALLQKFNLLN